MSIEDKRNIFKEHLATIKKEQENQTIDTAEEHFNYWLNEILKSKENKDGQRIELSYRHAVFMALQFKNYEEASILLDEYKQQEKLNQSNWYNRYAIRIYSNSPRFFLDHPKILLKHLEPIALSGSHDEKAKISNTLLSYVYIYENIYASKSNDSDYRLLFLNFIEIILPIASHISYDFSERLKLFKRLIDKEIDQQTYNEIIDFEPMNYDERHEKIEESTIQSNIIYNKKSKILIIGQPAISNDELYETAKEYGYAKKALEMYTDYDKLKNLDIRRFRNNEKYDGIIVGPIPHSVKGRDYDSVISEILSSQSGYPFWIKCKTESGEFKMTKSSFQKAIRGIKFNQEGNVL